VKVGDAVTFRMSRGSYEAHTATTGPGAPRTATRSSASSSGPSRGRLPIRRSSTRATRPRRGAAHTDQPRQRVLQLGRARLRQGVPAARVQHGPDRRGGDVHVLLRDPPVHEGDGRRE
jgi:hypothetical protein